MPRLRQVSRGESDAPVVTNMYEYLFGERDPVAEPGTAVATDGWTPGDWWTVFALVPDVLDHAVRGFGLYRSSRRKLDPVLRELGQGRAGWDAGSQFVYSQHCKSLRNLGVAEEKVAALAVGPSAEGLSPLERTVLAYTDCLVLDNGRVPDPLFAALRDQLSDEEILELTYITTMYFQHAVMSRALRTEFDDRDDPVAEVPDDGGAWSR